MSVSDLRVGQVLLSENRYSAILAERLERLSEQRAVCADRGLRQRFARCITATKRSEGNSQKLLRDLELLRSALPTSRAALFARAVDSATPDFGLMPDWVSDAAMDYAKRSWTDSVKLVEDAYMGAPGVGCDHDPGDAVLEKLSALDGPIAAADLSTHCVFLVTAIRTLQTTLCLASTYTRLAELHRGLLYVGIVRRQGNALQRKAIGDAFIQLLGAIVGSLVPGWDFAQAGGSLIRAMLDLESADSMIKGADQLIAYTRNYEKVLELWDAMAVNLSKGALSLRDMLLGVEQGHRTAQGRLRK